MERERGLKRERTRGRRCEGVDEEWKDDRGREEETRWKKVKRSRFQCYQREKRKRCSSFLTDYSLENKRRIFTVLSKAGQVQG